MNPKPAKPPPTMDALAARQRLFILLFLIQGILIYIGITLLDTGFWPSLQDFIDALGNTRNMLDAGSLTALLAAMQVLLLSPVRPPRPTSDPRPSTLRLVAVALSVGVIVAALCVYGLLAAESLRLVSTDRWYDRAILCTPVVVAPPVFIFMRWRFRDGMPVTLSIIAAALMAGVLLAGVVLGLHSIAMLLWGTKRPDSPPEGLLLIPPLVGWVIFTPIIAAFVRKGARESQLSRIASRLLIGSSIEFVAAIPVEAMMRKRNGCFCENGSFWTIVFSMSVGAIVLGPAIYLVPFRRYHMRLAQGRCRACGYDMTATLKAERCPECGVGWKAEGLGS